MDDEIEDDLPDPMVRNPPPKIFLNVGPIEEDCDFSELDEVCWNSEQIFDADVEYVLAPHREVDGLMAKICDLEEKLARLEDLRRWRPMSEHPDVPMAAPFVLIRELGRDGKHDPEVGVMHAMWVNSINVWMDEDGDLLRNQESWQWTYIPGQEPKEGV